MPAKYPSLWDRLVANVMIDELGCWIWVGPVRRHGGGVRFTEDSTPKVGYVYRGCRVDEPCNSSVRRHGPRIPSLGAPI